LIVPEIARGHNAVRCAGLQWLSAATQLNVETYG
jgi:hypothetical protein